MLTILPNNTGFTTRTLATTLANLPEGRTDVWFYYDTLPMELLVWMRQQGGELPAHDSIGNPIAYYLCEIYQDQLGLYVYDRSRQDFVATQHYGDVSCAECANDMIDNGPESDYLHIGLSWTNDVTEQVCDTCHERLDDQ